MLARTLVVRPAARARRADRGVRAGRGSPRRRSTRSSHPTVPPPPQIEPGAPGPSSGRDRARDRGARGGAAEPAAVPEPREGTQAPMLHGQLALSLEDALKMGLENNLDVQVRALLAADRGDGRGDRVGRVRSHGLRRVRLHGLADSRTRTSCFGTTESVNRTTDGFARLPRTAAPARHRVHRPVRLGSRSPPTTRIEALSPEVHLRLARGRHAAAAARPDLEPALDAGARPAACVFEASQENFRSAVMDTVRNIEDAYWNLMAATRGGARRGEEPRDRQGAARADAHAVRGRRGLEGRGDRGGGGPLAARGHPDPRAQRLPQPAGRADRPGARQGAARDLHPRARPDRQPGRDHRLRDRARVGGGARLREPTGDAGGGEGDRAPEGAARVREEPAPARARRGLLVRPERALRPSRIRTSTRAVSSIRDPNAPPGCLHQSARTRLESVQGNWRQQLRRLRRLTRPTSARARFSIPIPNTSARKTVDRTEFELARAETRMHRLEQDDHPRGAHGRAQSGGLAGGHRGARRTRGAPPTSSCAPSASGSSTASRRPSTCCCARSSSWTARTS